MENFPCVSDKFQLLLSLKCIHGNCIWKKCLVGNFSKLMWISTLIVAFLYFSFYSLVLCKFVLFKCCTFLVLLQRSVINFSDYLLCALTSLNYSTFNSDFWPSSFLHSFCRYRNLTSLIERIHLETCRIKGSLLRDVQKNHWNSTNLRGVKSSLKQSQQICFHKIVVNNFSPLIFRVLYIASFALFFLRINQQNPCSIFCSKAWGVCGFFDD